jgi:Cu/Ag efflux protein CusF
MRNLAVVSILLTLAGCAKQAPEQQTSTTTAASPAAGKTYPMNAVIVSRDAAKNMINLDNEDVPGVMAPMKMDYELRGAKVDSIPPDGTKVQVTLHEQDGKYWVTDVKPRS